MPETMHTPEDIECTKACAQATWFVNVILNAEAGMVVMALDWRCRMHRLSSAIGGLL